MPHADLWRWIGVMVGAAVIWCILVAALDDRERRRDARKHNQEDR